MFENAISSDRYQFTNVTSRVFTKVVNLLRRKHVSCKASAAPQRIATG